MKLILVIGLITTLITYLWYHWFVLDYVVVRTHAGRMWVPCSRDVNGDGDGDIVSIKVSRHWQPTDVIAIKLVGETIISITLPVDYGRSLVLRLRPDLVLGSGLIIGVSVDLLENTFDGIVASEGQHVSVYGGMRCSEG